MTRYASLLLLVITVAAKCPSDTWSLTGEAPCEPCPAGYKSRADGKSCFVDTCSHIFCQHEHHDCHTQKRFEALAKIPGRKTRLSADPLCDGRKWHSVRVYHTGHEDQCRHGHRCAMEGTQCVCRPTTVLPDYPSEGRYADCDDSIREVTIKGGYPHLPESPFWRQRIDRGGTGLRYVCDDQHVMQGADRRYCLANATWGPPPVCVSRVTGERATKGPNILWRASRIHSLVHHTCKCEHGQSRTGTSMFQAAPFCNKDDDHVCKMCYEGHYLQDHKCKVVTTTCNCEHGEAAKPVACPFDGAEWCESCDNGFVLRDGKCWSEAGYRGTMAATPFKGSF